MTRIVVGHGGYFPSDDWTFVPIGMRLHFHAEQNHELKFHMAVKAVEEAMSGRSVESRRSGAKVPNYAFTALDSISMGNLLRATGKSVELTFAGSDGVPNPVRLCEGNEITCRPPKSPPSSDPNAGPPGQHRCGGLLALFGGERNVHLIACRVREGDKAPPVTKYTASGKPVKDTSFFEDVQGRRKKYREHIAKYPGVLQDFQDLPEEEQVYLLSDLKILRWWRLACARKYLIANGKYAFYRYYRSDLEAKPDLDRSTDAVYKGFFASIGDAIAEVERELKQFLNPNTAEAERLELWMAMHPDRDRPNFMALDPWIYEWAAHQSSAPSPALVKWHDVDQHNGNVLLGLRHGDEESFWLHGDRLLIGHDNPYFGNVREIVALPDHCEGRVWVNRLFAQEVAGSKSSGTVHVKFTSNTVDRTAFEEGMARIPKDIFAYDLAFE